MHSPLISWSRRVYLFGVVALLVLVLPFAWFPFQLAKVAVFALVLLLAGVLFLAGRGASDLVRVHGLKLAYLVLLLPIVYALSAWLSGGARWGGILGYGVEVDTALFTALASITFILAVIYFRTLRTARLLTSVLQWSLVLLVVVQAVVILFGQTLLPFDIFADRSTNLLGKWNDFGIAVGLLSILLLVKAELAPLSTLKRVGLGVALVALTLLLSIVNFPFVWWSILLASVVLGLTAVFTQRAEDREAQANNPYTALPWFGKIPWFSLAAVLVSAFFLLFGSQVNNELTKTFPVSSLEVRPSYQSTLDVIGKARGGSLGNTLIGTGPNTFADSWMMHKPGEVNQSAFWNLDFNVGFSTVLTALGTVGLVGAAVWLVPILLVLLGLVRAVRLSVLNREERTTALAVGLGALVCLSALVFYVPSPSVALLGFVLGGAAFGFLWRQGRASMSDEEVPANQAMLGWGALVLIVLIAAGVAFVSDRRFLAQAQTNQGSVALQVGNADDATKAARASQKIEVNGDNLRLAVSGGLLKLQQIANSASASSAETQEQFKTVASDTIAAGQTLVQKYPDDYRSYGALGSVYDLLASLQVQGAYASALDAYKKAMEQNPSSPQIALTIARLAAQQGDQKTTEQYLSQALTLKPNYTDAILLVVQLNVANKDLPSAIRAAQAAAQTAPGVASIWFELGLLYYSGNDTKNAIPALEQAISIVPNYANAKYFLGLSYYAQNRPQDALNQFTDLEKSNPDSPEVRLIASNLRLGKAPFDSAQPPVTDKPEDRTSAPITE